MIGGRKSKMNSGQLKRNIRLVNYYRILFPIIFLLILIYAARNSSIINCLFPTKTDMSQAPSELYSNGISYIETTPGKLYYSGYDYYIGSNVEGHYYYSLENGKCTIFVFSKDFFPDGVQKTLENTTFEAELIPAGNNFEELMTLMARDMNWTYNGISACTDTVIVSQMNYAITPSILLAVFLYFSFAFSSGHILILLYNIINPYSAFTFVALGHRRTRREVIIKAAFEFENKVRFQAENMYMTDHFFIYVSRFNIAIIPINNMAWAYKYSRLHKYHFFGRLSYTVKIITKQKVPYIFNGKSKESADNLLAYLEKRNTHMLVGYTQENYRNSKHLMESIFSYFFR